MEQAPTIERKESPDYDRGLEGERALTMAIDTIEERLGKHLENATPAERIAITTELLNEIDERNDNNDRHVAEVYAGLKQMALLEKSFFEKSEELRKVIH